MFRPEAGEIRTRFATEIVASPYIAPPGSGGLVYSRVVANWTTSGLAAFCPDGVIRPERHTLYRRPRPLPVCEQQRSWPPETRARSTDSGVPGPFKPTQRLTVEIRPSELCCQPVQPDTTPSPCNRSANGPPSLDLRTGTRVFQRRAALSTQYMGMGAPAGSRERRHTRCWPPLSDLPAQRCRLRACAHRPDAFGQATRPPSRGQCRRRPEPGRGRPLRSST